jgi:hypothetical protein
VSTFHRIRRVDLEWAAEAYRAGWTFAECALELGLSETTCRRRLTQMGIKARRTGKRLVSECKRGHALSGENVLMKGKYRNCRACARWYKRESRGVAPERWRAWP